MSDYPSANMNKLHLLALLFIFASCQKGHYRIETSSAIRFPEYSKSFAIIENQQMNRQEERMTTSIRKHLIKSKWIYDDQNPDLLVTLYYEDLGSSIQINLIDAYNFKCLWQGKIVEVSRHANDQHFDRMAYSALGR